MCTYWNVWNSWCSTFEIGLYCQYFLRSVDISRIQNARDLNLAWECHNYLISCLKSKYIRLASRIVKQRSTMKYKRSPQGYLIIRKGLWKTEKQIHTTKCKRYVMQHTVRWAGRCCGHGGCYPPVSCACYSTHTKISKLSSVVSILKYRKYVAFSYSWIELQGQINNYTSTPWKENHKLKWCPKWTGNYFSS